MQIYMKNLSLLAVYCASATALSAQGLFNITPNDEAQTSIPLKWTAGVNFGYDDNLNPGEDNEESSASVTAFVGASLVNVDAQTTWDAYANFGYTTYFDDPGDGISDDVYNISGGFNLLHRVNERLRFQSRNRITYGLEPDYSFGLSASRRLDEYFTFNTDNSIGYRWTERFGTITGVTYEILDFDNRNNDRDTLGFYNQFRYQASPQTVLTGTYRFTTTDNPNGRDSDNHFITAGAEHRISPTSIVTLNVGAQIRNVDDGGENTSNPFVEAAYRSRVSQQFSHRLFVRYSVEDFDTFDGNGGFFDNNEAFRVGYAADYTVSQQLTLHGGINYINNSFEDSSVPGVSDADSDIINAFIGFSYEVHQGLFLTGSYNHTTSDSDDFDVRDFERNRFELGVRANF